MACGGPDGEFHLHGHPIIIIENNPIISIDPTGMASEDALLMQR